MSKDFFVYNLEKMKENYPSFKEYQNYHVFTLFCMKYFYYKELNIPFDQDIVLEYLTDGANDGGIDAIFNDPTSESNDVIVIQSKYYTKTDLTINAVVGELHKIFETLNNLKLNKIEHLNSKVVSAYRNAISQMEDGARIKVVFFTSYETKNQVTKNNQPKKLSKYFKDYDIEFNFGDDIKAQVDICENSNLFIDDDKIKIDKRDNYLEYEDSVVVNISALSLQDLYNRRRNGLLGMNLRYYTNVRKKEVDDGIVATITNEPYNFWYKNNGIVIICDDYKIDGCEVRLKKFSIINGGQTTYRLSKINIEKDFYLQCKVVKAKGISRQDRDDFSLAISKATNSQKPIKNADLRANASEQLRLKERLKHCDVFYSTKKGEEIPVKKYPEPYQVAKMEQVGKLCLAGVLQMPGSSRSGSQKMYKDSNYYLIFGDEAKEQVIADLLKISYYYDLFRKKYIKNKIFDETTELPMMKNGKTFLIASIMFICKINYGVFTYNEISKDFDDIDSLKKNIKRMENMDKLITAKVDNEEEIFMEIFTDISTEVLASCYEDAMDRAREDNKTIVASDFLKADNNYYKYIIKRLWSRYNNRKRLKNNIDLICGKDS